MKNNKSFAPILALIIMFGVLAIGGVAYFAGKNSTSKNTFRDNQTPFMNAAQNIETNPSSRETFEGNMLVRDNVWILLVMHADKTASSYRLQFADDSTCTIGPATGSCFSLQSNFGQGISDYSIPGGDSVSIEGVAQGDSIIVKRLILERNSLEIGNLVQNFSFGQSWSLVYQPLIGDTIPQNPNRPTSTVLLKFDEKSICRDDIHNTAEKVCNISELHNNDFVNVNGLKYQGALIVRNLVIAAQAPTNLPRN